MYPLLFGILLLLLPSCSHSNESTTWCHTSDHDEHGLPESIDFLRDLFQRYGHDGHNQTCTIGKHGLELLLKDIGIANNTHGHEEHDEHEGHGDEDLDHARRRRSLPDAARHLVVVRRSTHETHTGVTSTCYNQTELLQIHSLDATAGVDRAGLISLCPALIQQRTSKACWKKAAQSENQEITDAQKYGFGTLAVLLISFLAMPGIVVSWWRNSGAYKYIIATMLGLAVGSLFGDATLHLIPQALGLHGHEDEGGEHDHGHGSFTVQPYVWKMLALNFGAYAFFILQASLAIWVYKKKGSLAESDYVADVKGGMDGSYHQAHDQVAMENGKDNASFEMANGDTKIMANGSVKASDDKPIPPEKSVSPLPQNKELGGSREKMTDNVDDSLGWMVCIGDGIHNFADGLAIGASFAAGWRSGLATSIAVACHELPHELGDIAVMLSVGWSARKVACLNFLAAMACFVGLYIGIPVSQNIEARQWIFTITAGMFLYIALADILPEIQELMEKHSPTKISVLAGCGMLTGLTIMLLIAIFEDRIRIG